MDTHEEATDTSVSQKVVQVELIVQTRQKDTDPWHNQSPRFGGIFKEAALDHLRLVRVGYPGLKSRLIERSVIYSDKVVED